MSLLAAGIPVLMYHWVHPDPGDRLRLYGVTPGAFAAQMARLAAAGYRSADLSQLLDHMAGRSSLPPRRVVITFDDGYVDNVEHAGPVLDGLGWTATIFVVTDHAGGVNAWDAHHGDPPRPLLDWSAMRRHDGKVFTFEPHSRSHPDLTLVDPGRARDEIAGAGQRLQDELGRAAGVFAYPHGAFDALAESLVRQAGYRAAVTDRQGLNRPGSDPFRIRRTMITSRDVLPTFAFKVLTGYGVMGLRDAALRRLAGAPARGETGHAS